MSGGLGSLRAVVGATLAQGAGESGRTAAEQTLAAAHRAMLQTPGLQFRFDSAPPPDPTPYWAILLNRFLVWAAPVLKLVFWGGLILGAAVVIYFIVREVFHRKYRARPAPAAPPLGPAPAEARALLADADRLAAEGQFDEAAHLLLFRSIETLESRRAGLVRPALTSRDIAKLEALSSEARQAFSRIVAAVELSFFGGRRLDAIAFAECRRAYETFAGIGA